MTTNMTPVPATGEKSKLRILLLEDSAVDAQIIGAELKRGGFDFRLTLIQTEQELRRELDRGVPDVILSDHGLPSFDGFTALKIVREKHPRLPFIFVSGSNNQGMVAEMHDQGATDYVFKNDIHDLSPVLRQALTPQTDAVEETVSSQNDFASPKSTAVAARATRPPRTGRLSFCPKCLLAWDEKNNPAQLQNYLEDHAEISVVRELCPACRARL